MVQDQLPNSLTFTYVDIGNSPQLSMRGALTDYINFWGISNLKIAVSENSSSLITDLNSSTDNVLAIASFSITSNTAVSGVFFQKNKKKDCSYNNFYSTKNLSCIDSCSYPHAIILWNSTRNNSLHYCLSSPAISQRITTASFTDSNIETLGEYAPEGCLRWKMTSDVDILCKVCQHSFSMINGSCLCNYGWFLQKGSCHPCSHSGCLLATK